MRINADWLRAPSTASSVGFQPCLDPSTLAMKFGSIPVGDFLARCASVDRAVGIQRNFIMWHPLSIREQGIPANIRGLVAQARRWSRLYGGYWEAC
jgi:hypothetical protein